MFVSKVFLYVGFFEEFSGFVISVVLVLWVIVFLIVFCMGFRWCVCCCGFSVFMRWYNFVCF